MIATAVPDETTTLTVVVSRGQSRNPEKRGLETAVAEAAAKLAGVEVLIVPHLYDLPRTSESLAQLRSIEGDLLIVSWIYGRAARWVLDRNGVRGSDDGLAAEWESDDSDMDDPVSDDLKQDGDQVVADLDDPIERVTDLHPRPTRQIGCIDLKQIDSATVVLDAIRRKLNLEDSRSLPIVGGNLQQIDETTSRRWYPVIDFDRCTNCMECVDFCLFGVYGVDGAETILVEQPDNCRKGCPACSRVCPENAIIFPQHKAPAIAGAQTVGNEGFKIDLSLLFGAPAGGDDPIATAARERDEQLLLTGRQAIGVDDQLARRRADVAATAKDNLDVLIDQLDALDI